LGLELLLLLELLLGLGLELLLWLLLELLLRLELLLLEPWRLRSRSLSLTWWRSSALVVPSKEVVESVPDAGEESSLWDSRGTAKQRNQ